VSQETIRPDDASLTSLEEDVKEPKKFRIIMHNDDYTTMDFVVHVLKAIFHKTEAQANDIMLRVHKYGRGVCGVYTAELATTKITQVTRLSKSEGYPLKCTMEEV
jgi:ATP-dependent Clp protease adaptor protein ClpS